MDLRHTLGGVAWALASAGAAGCLEVGAGSDCLVVTEVSTIRPGPVAFDTTNCRPLHDDCPGDLPRTTAGYCPCPTKIEKEDRPIFYCGDYVEVCNFTSWPIDSARYHVANHEAFDQPNPYAPEIDRMPLGRGTGGILPPNTCAVFPLEPHDNDMDSTPTTSCATSAGLEMDTVALFSMEAIDALGRRSCQVSLRLDPTAIEGGQVWGVSPDDPEVHRLEWPTPRWDAWGGP